MDVSDKRSAFRDDSLGDDQPTRAEEFRRDQGPTDDEPDSPARETRGDVHQDQPGVLDDADADRRADLARFVDPSAFPARPAALVESAQTHFAPDWIVSGLRSLPDGVYDNVQDVWRALGGAVEERRA